MNILFLSEMLHPHGGGAELATYLYASLLSKADFNVAVITNRFAGELEFSKSGNLAIYRLPLFKGSRTVKYSILRRFDVLFSSFMRKMVKWADVVYIPRFWYSAIPLAKAYGKPVITHLHDYIPICPLSNIYDALKDAVCNHNSQLCSAGCIYVYERTQGRGFRETLTSVTLNSTLGRYLGKFVKLSDAIICVSKAQKNIITKVEPSLSAKIHVIYNPLPEPSYIDIEGNDFGYFGGLDFSKGFHILCKAMMHINRVNHKSTRIHATKFPDSDEQLIRSLGQLGILPYGKLDSDEYEKVYRQVRAVIVPSIWPEPWPYVVVEAIIRGRFIIASSTGGIPEQVEGCKGTLLFESGNHKQLAEAIEFVRSLNRETITDLGFQNKETFLKRFDDETTIRRFIGVYEHLT
jgi:glycosyltransferase involved in cell wall biosynthesis